MASAINGTTIACKAGSYEEGGVYWLSGSGTPGGNATFAGVVSAVGANDVIIQNAPGEVVRFDGSE